MGRIIRKIAAAALAALAPALLSAQEAVHDALGTATNIENSWQALKQAIEEFGELTEFSDRFEQFGTMMKEIYDVTETGMEYLRTSKNTARAVMEYEKLCERAVDYSKWLYQNPELSQKGVVDLTTELRYLNSVKQGGIALYQMIADIFASKKTLAEKEEEVGRVADKMGDLKEDLEQRHDGIVRAQAAGEGVAEFLTAISQSSDVDQYVRDRENDGNANDIGNSVLKVVMLILGLLGILSLAWGFVLYGREAGQGANHLIFVRIAVAMFAALLVLGLLDKII